MSGYVIKLDAGVPYIELDIPRDDDIPKRLLRRLNSYIGKPDDRITRAKIEYLFDEFTEYSYECYDDVFYEIPLETRVHYGFKPGDKLNIGLPVKSLWNEKIVMRFEEYYDLTYIQDIGIVKYKHRMNSEKIVQSYEKEFSINEE